jgi:hypothetical protein
MHAPRPFAHRVLAHHPVLPSLRRPEQYAFEAPCVIGRDLRGLPLEISCPSVEKAPAGRLSAEGSSAAEVQALGVGVRALPL